MRTVSTRLPLHAMILTRRAAPLVGLAVAFTVLVVLRFSSPLTAWRNVPQVVGLGDLVDDVSHRGSNLSSKTSGYEDVQSGPWGTEAQFVPGAVKAPGNSYSRALVIATTKETNLTWMDEADIPHIAKRIYVADNPKAPLHPPKNKGHEGMIYLTYIIDHYNTLPDVSIFMHAHQYAWHNNDLLNNDAAEMVNRLSSERVLREGFMNLRCHWNPGCPDWVHPGVVEKDVNKQEESMMAQAWSEIFPDKPIPEVLAQPCCAQFALSRDRIRAISLQQYEFYRQWLLRTRLDDQISGRIWEYLWQVVFTGQSTFCPDQRACYCDGYGVCFEDDKAFDYWFEIRYKKGMAEEELEEWEDRAAKVETWRQNGMLNGAEAAQLSIPKVGRDMELVLEIEKYSRELEEKRWRAIELGVNPAVRAAAAGRTWAEGDGY